jgi:hypothetical protein
LDRDVGLLSLALLSLQLLLAPPPLLLLLIASIAAASADDISGVILYPVAALAW